MRTGFIFLVLLFCWAARLFAAPPVLTPPTTENVGANLATLILQSGGTGTGYFTLLTGSDAPCGSATQVVAGQTNAGITAPCHGSLPLNADATGRYTIRNLTQQSPYTVCFTADSPTGVNLNPSPVTANLTTATAISFPLPVWGSVGSAGFSTGRALYTSLAIASDGTPYVAFSNQDNGGKATVMKYGDGAWSVVGNAGFSPGDTAYTSLVFAPDGTPYVLFLEKSNSRPTVMKYSGGSWVLVGSAGFSTAFADHPSLAIAPDGTPFVAYTDYGSATWGITVMKFTGGVWSMAGSSGFSAAALDTVLALAPDGTPHVAFSDTGTTPPGKITVMKYGGGVWSTVGFQGISADFADKLSLAVAPDGVLYVAYRDQSSSFKGTVMKYGGGAWSVVGSAGFSAGSADYTSLAIAPDGTPFVAFEEGAVNKGVVMKFSGGVWGLVGNSGLSAGQAQYSSLAFSPDGTPFVAYQDMGNSGMASVMRLKVDTVTQVVADHNPAVQGQVVTFTVMVLPVTATGTVTMRDGATELGSVTLSGGTASYRSSVLTTGSHTITALYAGDGGDNGSSSFPLTQLVNAPYPLTVTITGNGSVNSVPAGIACTGSPQSGTCGASYLTGPKVTLVESPGNSLFSGWGGGCAICGKSSSCPVSVESAMACSAVFASSPLVVLVGSTQNFSSLQSAYVASASGNTIKAQVVTLVESLLFNVAGKTVTIRGGYDPSFTIRSGVTTVKGGMVISKGLVIMERLAIR